MGIWKDIKHAINSTLGTSSFQPLDRKIDEVKSSIMAAGGIKVVKSVQRGVTTNTSIIISSVVPNKCIVLLNNEVVGFSLTATGNNEDYVYGAYVSSLSETKLTITNNRTTYKGTTHNVSWQVVEFY